MYKANAHGNQTAPSSNSYQPIRQSNASPPEIMNKMDDHNRNTRCRRIT